MCHIKASWVLLNFLIASHLINSRKLSTSSHLKAERRFVGGQRRGFWMGTQCCLWIYQGKLCHWSFMEPVYTLGTEGRGLVEAAPQQQRTAYGKCASYLTKTVMSSDGTMRSHVPSPLLDVCACMRLVLCMCMFLMGLISKHLPYAASPSGCPQLDHSGVTAWMIPSCTLNELHNKLMCMGDLSYPDGIMSIHWLIKVHMLYS